MNKKIKIIIGMIICIVLAVAVSYSVKAVDNKIFDEEMAKINISVNVSRYSSKQVEMDFTVINDSKYVVEILCDDNSGHGVYPLSDAMQHDGSDWIFDKINNNDKPYTIEYVNEFDTETEAQEAYDGFLSNGFSFKIYRSGKGYEKYYETVSYAVATNQDA